MSDEARVHAGNKWEGFPLYIMLDVILTLLPKHEVLVGLKPLLWTWIEV